MSTTAQAGATLTPFPAGTTKYQMLGVNPDATGADLKIGYRRSALLYHPDRHPEEDRPVAERIFKDVTAAYRTLSNADSRRRYDRALLNGHEYRETAAAEAEVRLEDILADIQEYEYVFSREHLSGLDAAAIELVTGNLMTNLGEQVVAVYPLKQAPVDASFQGTFKTGAVVLTNLRVLMPFTYEWQVTDGNVRTTYKGLSVPNAVLPLVTRLRIASRKRLSPDVLVRIEQADRSVAFQAGQRNLAKLLLIASLWGIPCEAEDTSSRTADLKAALVHPWTIVAWCGVAVLVIAAIVGFFSGAGIIGAPMALAAWSARIGIAQALVLLTTARSARGLWRWIATYQTRDLAALLRTGSTAGGAPAAGPLVGTA